MDHHQENIYNNLAALGNEFELPLLEEAAAGDQNQNNQNQNQNNQYQNQNNQNQNQNNQNQNQNQANQNNQNQNQANQNAAQQNQLPPPAHHDIPTIPMTPPGENNNNGGGFTKLFRKSVTRGDKYDLKITGKNTKYLLHQMDQHNLGVPLTISCHFPDGNVHQLDMYNYRVNSAGSLAVTWSADGANPFQTGDQICGWFRFVVNAQNQNLNAQNQNDELHLYLNRV